MSRTANDPVVLIVQEVKRNAVGCTSEQAEKWQRFLQRYEPTARVTAVPETSTIIGNNWAVECEDKAEARWPVPLVDRLLRVHRDDAHDSGAPQTKWNRTWPGSVGPKEQQ